jgi:hypothetical protein
MSIGVVRTPMMQSSSPNSHLIARRKAKDYCFWQQLYLLTKLEYSFR